MDYCYINLKIGMTGRSPVDDLRKSFYDKVAHLIFPRRKNYNRIGSIFSVHYSHLQYVHYPRNIENIIVDFISESLNGRDNVDFCIIDFTSNKFVSVRDPLLMALADGINSIAKKKYCDYFAVLLPELPSYRSASMKHFHYIARSSLKDLRISIILISSDGKSRTFPKDIKLPASMETKYNTIYKNHFKIPTEIVEGKCIKRMGHFQTVYSDGSDRCRSYSYFMYNCEHELFQIFSDWWKNYAVPKTAILYDLKNNIGLKNAVRAFGLKNGVMTERIDDAITKNKKILKELKKYKYCIIVVDVVYTGKSIISFIEKLSSNIVVSKNIVTAINAKGSKTTKLRSYKIHGIVSRKGEAGEKDCLQCKLKMPLMSDAQETSSELRAFDYYSMANESGWDPEPFEEVPGDPKERYEMLPIFSQILEKNGDWLAYKMKLLLDNEHIPDDFFIIHPDESDSSAISDLLEIPFDYKLNVIRIERGKITSAQNNNNDWSGIVKRDKDSYYINELNSSKKASALILDIFNASASTLVTIVSLLNYMNINIFGYLCLTDFNPTASNKLGIPVYSLYSFSHPRSKGLI